MIFKCSKFKNQDLHTMAMVKRKKVWAMQLFFKVLFPFINFLKPDSFS